MIGLLRNGVICTVKDADMPILFCTFSYLLSPPFRVNMVTTKGCRCPVDTSAKQKHRPRRQPRQSPKLRRKTL